MPQLSDSDVERIADSLFAKLKPTIADGTRAEGDGKILAATIIQELSSKSMAMLGVDLADKVQVDALTSDLRMLRSMRINAERMGRNVATVFTQAVTWGLIGLLVLGFWWWTRGGGAPAQSMEPTITK